jgi:glycogen operon protein
VLRRRQYATGVRTEDIRWFQPSGEAMTDSDWGSGWARSLLAYLDGCHDADRDALGRLVLDDDLLLLVNGWSQSLSFTIPDVGARRIWRKQLDTYQLTGDGGGPERATATTPEGPALRPGSGIELGPRSLVLLSARS